MAEPDVARIARQAWDAWNAHDPERYVKLLDEQFVLESDNLPGPVKGREAARGFMKAYLVAFPDLHFAIDQTLVSGDHVVTRYTATGTHRGELRGIPPTNRHATMHGCSVSEVKHGKLLHSWTYWDSANLLRQLGVLPSGS